MRIKLAEFGILLHEALGNPVRIKNRVTHRERARIFNGNVHDVEAFLVVDLAIIIKNQYMIVPQIIPVLPFGKLASEFYYLGLDLAR